jgi:predicted SprT family Zn-dependent metalloprotease
MELQNAKELAETLMNHHGLILSGWKFNWIDTKRTIGRCSYTMKTIYLNREYVSLNDQWPVRDTILHEIAHALCSISDKHGPNWKRMCVRIGANPQALTDVSSIIAPVGNVVGTCPNGHISKRYRIPRTERSCSTCSPKFNRNFLITYKKID